AERGVCGRVHLPGPLLRSPRQARRAARAGDSVVEKGSARGGRDARARRGVRERTSVVRLASQDRRREPRAHRERDGASARGCDGRSVARRPRELRFQRPALRGPARNRDVVGREIRKEEGRGGGGREERRGVEFVTDLRLHRSLYEGTAVDEAAKIYGPY